MGQPSVAKVIVRPATAQEREPPSTGRLCAYVDETAMSVGPRQMFGVGALLTPNPVGPAVVARAMSALQCDPDRPHSASRYKQFRDALDRNTPAHVHSHASEDRANAHSHFARAISGCI